MKTVERDITKHLALAAKSFPSVVITGPRRAGKTFLLRHLFPKAEYYLFEDPDIISRFRQDPQGFLDGEEEQAERASREHQEAQRHRPDDNLHEGMRDPKANIDPGHRGGEIVPASGQRHEEHQRIEEGRLLMQVVVIVRRRADMRGQLVRIGARMARIIGLESRLAKRRQAQGIHPDPHHAGPDDQREDRFEEFDFRYCH
jgi:hypothetical protein